MKKINLLLIALLLMACVAHAQRKQEYPYINKGWVYFSYDYTLDYEFKISLKMQKARIVKAGIKELTQTNTKKKKTYMYAKLSFDNKGNCIAAAFNRKNGKLKRQCIYTYTPENLVQSKTMLNGKGKELKKLTYKYNSDSLMTEQVFYRKGKEIKKNTCEYNKFRQSTDMAFFRKGKPKARKASTYDSTRVLESYFYKKGSPAYKWKWIYSYYDNKTHKTSMMYDAAGKVKYTWNYDCKPEGELVKKHADSTLICQNLEYDKDSNRTYTWREFNEKGKPIKRVSVLSKDRKMLQYAMYHDNDIPSYFYKYHKATGELEEQIFYKHNGKEQWKTINIFDTNNNIIEEDGYPKGILKYKSLKQYNTQNFVVNTSDYTKNKLESTSKYDYVFF